MTGPGATLPWVVRRPRRIIMIWVLLIALLLPGAARLGDLLTAGTVIAGSESAATAELLRGPLRTPFARPAVLVVRGAPAVSTPEGEAVLREIVDAVTAVPVVQGVSSWLDRRDSLYAPAGESGTMVIVGLTEDRPGAAPAIAVVRKATSKLQMHLAETTPGVTFLWTGEPALNADLREASRATVRESERRALPPTALLLLLAFGAVGAAILPILAAAVAIPVAMGLAAIAAGIWPLAVVLHAVISMLGLGLGVDYGLLLVARFREASAQGEPRRDAVATAVRTAGHTILLSAGSVAVGFFALGMVPLPEVRAIAVGGVVITVATALVALTLLPAVLVLAGGWLSAGRVPGIPGARGLTIPWRRIAEAVTRHPWRALAVSLPPLLLLVAQAFRMQPGIPDGNWLPRTMESEQGIRALQGMERSAVVQGVRAVLRLPAASPAHRGAGWRAVVALQETLQAAPHVARVVSIVDVAREVGVGRTVFSLVPDSVVRGLVSDDRLLVRFDILPTESSTPGEVAAMVRAMREVVSGATGLEGATIQFGGLAAFNADYEDAVGGRFGAIASLILAATFLAMAFALRSVLVPLKALLLNLVSVGAAFGVLTLVFQEGRGGALFGLDAPMGAVFATLPVVVFCVVFGLSMDYEVFLVTRVREERLAGRGEREAVVEGVVATGPVITSAAMVMLAVFVAFAMGEFRMVQMLGVALAVAVLLDATVVRLVIGPALLTLAGRWNWWPGERR